MAVVREKSVPPAPERNSRDFPGKGVLLSGWGRFPVEECQLVDLQSRDQLFEAMASGGNSLLARGLGRSYGDAALNRHGRVLSLLRLNRVLSFDEPTGVLECEAGTGLDEIIRRFLPLGFFLPVVPGTKFVTVGGAIASNIHGKNHHVDGNFANYVVELQLLLPSGEVVFCSPARNPEIFWATAGGMGLTGIILAARIQLRRVTSAFIAVDLKRTRDLDQTLEAFSTEDSKYQYSVCWIDGLASGPAMGRSVLIRGNHAAASDLSSQIESPLSLPRRRHWTVPFNFPNFTLNPLSIRVFNHLYYTGAKEGGPRHMDFESFFFPLDRVGEWNRIYGQRGFVQYQVALPQERGREALLRLLAAVSSSRRSSFLAVLKRFGPADRGLLSFPLAGYTLSLDLPASEGIVSFLRGLDKIVIEFGGRIYLAKDAVVLPSSLALMYPKLDQFRRVKRQVDPGVKLSSSLARRTEILGKDSRN